MAWPTTSRDDTYGGKRGSAYAAMMEVLSTGAPLGSPDTIHPIGFLQSGKWDRKVSTDGEEDVGGTVHNSVGKTDAVLTLKPMQRDAVHLEAPKAFTGYARLYQELTSKKLNSTLGQIGVIACVKFDGSFGWDLSDMYREWTMNASPNSTGSTLTIALTAFTGGLGAGVGNATIGVGEYEDIVEFTYA